jgi:hypothetical protein
VNDFQELVLKPKKVLLFSELLVTKNGEFLLLFGHLNCRLAFAAQRPTPGSLNYGSSASVSQVPILLHMQEAFVALVSACQWQRASGLLLSVGYVRSAQSGQGFSCCMHQHSRARQYHHFVSVSALPSNEGLAPHDWGEF